MPSVSSEFLTHAMKTCVQRGRMYQHVNPESALKELEKLSVLYSTLQSLNSFESKLLSDCLDID